MSLALVTVALALVASPPAAQKSLLVVGGSGFLGREICREAVRRGIAVTSLSRRGANPEPDSKELSRVTWKAGDASDADLIGELAANADAYVHSCGVLFDSESGLAPLNKLVSGAGSEASATYASFANSALALRQAALANGGGPLCYVSAIGADSRASDLFPDFLQRYLSAKSGVEQTLISDRKRMDAAASAAASVTNGVLPLLARPAPMYSSTKFDVLPVLPFWNAAAAVVPDLDQMLPVNVVGAGIVGAVAAAWAEEAPPLVLGASEIEQFAPLTALKSVQPLDTLTSGLASIVRLPYGTDVAEERRSGPPPADADLVLYDVEGDADCRRVRELITYLDLCATIKPCALGSRHRDEAAADPMISASGPLAFPCLVDRSAGVGLVGCDAICDHLATVYGAGVPPLEPPLGPLLALPAIFRPGRGTAVEERVQGKQAPEQPLKLYSYEGNQFCRLVREVLCELDLAYEMRSTGKGSPRRDELQKLSGKTTAPYLVDPNTDTAMGESADIVEYLYTQYG